MEVQNNNSVKDQDGNSSKPLLADVILTENEKWKIVCETVVQHALFEHIHVSDTIELLKSKFNLV